MLADALTKLAATSVISTLHLAMDGGSSSDTPLVSSALVDESNSDSSSPFHLSVPIVKTEKRTHICIYIYGITPIPGE